MAEVSQTHLDAGKENRFDALAQRAQFPDAASKERYVRELFERIALRYDRMNRIISLGQDVGWRRKAVDLAEVGPGDRVLDVACGTGDLALEAARRVAPAGRVVGVDFARDMLQIASLKARRQGMEGVCGFSFANALALPFPDGSFDAATIGFAMRNVTDILKTLREMRRVVRPGGRVVCLELSKPGIPGLRELYYLYFYRIVPLVGRLGIGRRGPYDYFPNSLTRFPDQEGLAALYRQAGFQEVRAVNLFGGVAAIHVGRA